MVLGEPSVLIRPGEGASLCARVGHDSEALGPTLKREFTQFFHVLTLMLLYDLCEKKMSFFFVYTMLFVLDPIDFVVHFQKKMNKRYICYP